MNINSWDRKIVYEGIWWSYYTYRTNRDFPSNDRLVGIWNKCFNESDEMRYVSDKKLLLGFLLRGHSGFYDNMCVYRVSAYKGNVKILNRYETIKEFDRMLKVRDL